MNVHYGGSKEDTQFRWTLNGLGGPIKQVAASPISHAAGNLIWMNFLVEVKMEPVFFLDPSLLLGIYQKEAAAGSTVA